MAGLDRALMVVASRTSKNIGKFFGDRFPMWFVCEYPKSGGTWLARILADYLDVPRIKHTRLPIAMESVLHNHWAYHPRLNRCFYLYRDGRDVMVSSYFHTMQKGGFEREGRFRFRHSLADVASNLPRFIEVQMTSRRPGKHSWPQHLDMWYDRSRPNVAFLSYEELLMGTVGAIAPALEQFGVAVDQERLQGSVDRNDFERLTGRRPGQEDAASFLRKGVAGDWVNYFTRESAEVFDRYAGNWLIRLGYENDNDWVKETPISL